MRKKLITSLLLAAVLLLPRISGAASGDVFEYSFQSNYIGPHVLNVHQYQPWIEDVKKRSGGRLIINFFLNGALVKNEESLPALKNGVLDIAGIGPMYTDTLFPHTLAFMVPHITRDSIHAARLYWKAYTTIPEIKAELDKQMKVLAVWGSDRSALFSIRDPILTPADLTGKRVLIWSGGQVDQVKAWGGTPVQTAPNDTYIALQRGMGDVFYGPLPVGVAYKLMEVSKNITIIPSSTLFLTIGMSWDAWKELPGDLQKIIDDTTGEEFSKRSGELLYEYTNKDVKTMEAAGVTMHTLTEAQYQAFKDADKAVTMDFWQKDLARLGNPDPAGAIARAYKLAAETPAAGQ